MLYSTLFHEIICLIKQGNIDKAKIILNTIKHEYLGKQGNLLQKKLHILCEKDNGFRKINNITGIYTRLPNTSERKAEGGKRLSTYNSTSCPQNNPKVTIITVVYNQELKLSRCIESVLSQTEKNIEYIIIDGGSNDGTLDLIKKYEKEVDYYVSETDNGIYNAMNKGLSVAKGEYIAFLNADDFYFPSAISDSLNHILKYDLDLSYASFFYTDDTGVAIVEDEARPWDSSMYIQGVPGGHETLFARRRCYDLIGGYDESYRIVADYDWFMRAFHAGFKAKPLEKTILVMREGGESFSEDQEKFENKSLLNKIFGNLDDDFAEFLYSLKYYKNWHGFYRDDRELISMLERAFDHSQKLQKSLFLTIEQRKNGAKGAKKTANPLDRSKLKIAIVLTFLKDASGGAERIAIESANELSRQGHGVTMVCCQGTAAEPFYHLDASIPLIDLAVHPYKMEYYEASTLKGLSFEQWGGREFKGLGFIPTEEDFVRWNKSPHMWRTRVYEGFFQKNYFDVVVSHMPSTYTYTLPTRSNRARTLHIAALHNAPQFKFFSDFYPAENQMERYMRLVSLENADIITVLFDQFIEQLPERLRSKAVTLTNFTSPQILQDTQNQNSQNDANCQTILAVGRLAPQKDHATLIKAYSIIRDVHPEWKLKIYGDGPLRKELEDLCASLDLDVKEILQGANRNIGPAYRGADILAFPSRFEGFGLALTEAMAFGVVPIGFDDCEGVKHLIDHEQDGLLVSGDNRIQGMADAILQLIRNPNLRKSLASKGKRKAELYTVSEYVNNLARIVANARQRKRSSHFPAVSKADLKVAILSTYLEGGAGIAASRLKEGLRRFGIDAKTVSFSQGPQDSHYQTELPPEAQAIYKNCFDLWRKGGGNTLFSSSYPSLSLHQLSFLKHFDIINLHWIQTMLSNEAIAYISRLGPPVVWTLHDMNAFTGGCHYSAGCHEYAIDCAHCPQVADGFKSYPSSVLDVKRKYWMDDIVVVTPSRWLADCARESQVFGSNPISVIPNGLDTDIFRPRDRRKARLQLGLPEDKLIMLFTCQSHKERRKGFAELIDMTAHIKASQKNVHLIMFGSISEEIEQLGLPFTALGHVHSNELLSLGYSAADVLVMPTLEDNLPNIILESAACGTPIVAFDSGGVSDAVVNHSTGYLVPRGKSDELAKFALQAAGEEWTARCRNYATRHFSLDVQSRAYSDLFHVLISKNNNFKPRYLPEIFNEMRNNFDRLINPQLRNKPEN